MLLTTAGCTNHAKPGSDDGISPAAHAYLTKALDTMQKHSLLRHRIDWPALRAKALTQAHGARKPADTYRAIEGALASLGDQHSHFWEPDEAKDRYGFSATAFDGLEGRVLKGGPGYISLPGVEGSDKTYDAYVRQGRSALAKADRNGACGWVVDLRSDTGGSMDPMFAVVGPILGDGNVGMFVDADGRKKGVWSVRHGDFFMDGTPIGWAGDRPLSGPTPPVAVLTGKQTASAGEAVTVAFRGRPHTRSFGEPTYGVPTGNSPYRLSDGAVIVLTEVKEADRTGRTYDTSIPPDQEIVNDPRPVARHRDETLDTATKWLLRQTACQQ
ncbi:S41 family peptidase [Streptomyces sp. NPDC059690]|uniref:S41 family peptidase n=1 Tax=Streptomyces sp. NPDC059690 TaxID=3346907 RepID=UPI0036ADC731